MVNGDDVKVEVKTEDGKLTILRGQVETPFVYRGFTYNLLSLQAVVDLVKSGGMVI